MSLEAFDLLNDIPASTSTAHPLACEAGVCGRSGADWNPLLCPLCSNALEAPVSLQCYHVFCLKCVMASRERETHRLKCPLCSFDCFLPDSVVTRDPLINYVVESAIEFSDVCANCDVISQPMFFCETCNQALCNACKEKTHQAKMFASHKVVTHEERTGANVAKKCKTHGEPYVLFCVETKSLMCINCFQTAQLDARPHFVDLDSAYKTVRNKLENTAKKLKTYQKEVDDCISLHHATLEEIRKNFDCETTHIETLCQQLIDKVVEARDQFLIDLSCEKSKREEALKRQLEILSHLSPTVRLYLLICSIFCSSACKLDTLELFSMLNARLQSILTGNQCQIQIFHSQIQKVYKAEFASSLEPLLGVNCFATPSGSNRKQSANIADYAGFSALATTSNDAILQAVRNLPGRTQNGASSTSAKSYNGSNNSGKSSLRNKNYSKLRLLVDLAGAFGDEYANIEVELKDINRRFLLLSKHAQEVQRDVTVRKCVIDESKLMDIASEAQKLKIDLGAHSTKVDDLQSTFQHIWEEQLDRVRKQQEVYRNHIASVLCLREDLHRTTTASQQLAPFVRSISHVIGAMNPQRRLMGPQCPMQKICSQINTLAPDSQIRVDAIERQEMHRKLELEEKKWKNDPQHLIEGVKRRLKISAKDPARRRSCLESGLILSSHSSNACVKNVDRDRNSDQEFSLQQQTSGNHPKISSKTETCPLPPIAPRHADPSSKLNRPTSEILDADSLCDTFQHFLLAPPLSHYCNNGSPKNYSNKSPHNNKGTVSSVSSSSVLNLLDLSLDGSETSAISSFSRKNENFDEILISGQCEISPSSMRTSTEDGWMVLNENSAGAVADGTRNLTDCHENPSKLFHSAGPSNFGLDSCHIELSVVKNGSFKSDEVNRNLSDNFDEIDVVGVKPKMEHLENQEKNLSIRLDRKFPISLKLAGVDPATLLARERLLASLKEKVALVDS